MRLGRLCGGQGSNSQRTHALRIGAGRSIMTNTEGPVPVDLARLIAPPWETVAAIAVSVVVACLVFLIVVAIDAFQLGASMRRDRV